MNGSVIVTGANSGIGYSITKHLNDNRVHVFACVRREETIPAFESLENVTPVILDVTKPESIVAAGRVISDSGRAIRGLVNNAGVPSFLPLFYVNDQDYNFVFDVNVLGVHRVTNQFIPALIKSKGRIIIISSISGIWSGFGSGFYTMSKHAIEAYGDTLSLELGKFGIHVALIEPGNYKSNLGNHAGKSFSRVEQIQDNIYAEEFQMFLAKRKSAGKQESPEPTEVAHSVYQALTTDSPKYRYLVVPNQQEAEMVIRKGIAEVLELNRDHNFSYTKDQLLEMFEQMYELDNLSLHLGPSPRS